MRVCAGQDEQSRQRIQVRTAIGNPLMLLEAIEPAKLRDWLNEVENGAKGFDRVHIELQHDEGVDYHSLPHDYLVLTGTRPETDEEYKRRQGHILAQKFAKLQKFRLEQGFYASGEGAAEIQEVILTYPNHGDLVSPPPIKRKKK